MSLLMSMSTCRAQSDSTQENPKLVALGKEDGKGERVAVVVVTVAGVVNVI